MLYLVSYAVLVAFLGLAPQKYGLRQNNYKNYIWICGALMAFLTMCRTPFTGTSDNYAYMIRYELLQNYETFQEYYDLRMADYDLLSSEAGFYYTMWFFGHFLKDGQWVFVISSFLITVATCMFIRKNSVNIPLSLTIYVCLGLFTFNMNGMRQAMAMSICLFAYEHAKNRKIIPFVITVLIAMLFHKTAMCFFPMYFLPKLKNNLGSWMFYVFGLILCLLFMDRIIAGYYEISGEDYSDVETSSGGGLFVILLYLGAIGLTIYKSHILERPSAQTALLATLTGFAAYISRFIGSDILERVSYYYFYFPILLIPEAFKELEEDEYKTIIMYFVVGALMLFAYRCWNGKFRNFSLFFLR